MQRWHLAQIYYSIVSSKFLILRWPGWPACALVQWLTIPLTILLLHAKATKQSKVNPATMFFLQMDKCYFTVGSGGCQNNHQRRAVLLGQNVVEEEDRGRKGFTGICFMKFCTLPPGLSSPQVRIQCLCNPPNASHTLHLITMQSPGQKACKLKFIFATFFFAMYYRGFGEPERQNSLQKISVKTLEQTNSLVPLGFPLVQRENLAMVPPFLLFQYTILGKRGE